MTPLHTPELISQISETVNEINAKKIRIIIFKTPDYPVLVFSPHTSTQNMQIKSYTQELLQWGKNSIL